ncbi:MAG: type VI secretion system tip protein TssI/VgrG [Myxococcota bacterium]
MSLAPPKLDLDGMPLVVLSVYGREAVNELYDIDVTATSATELELDRSLLGRPGSVLFPAAQPRRRRIDGIVTRCEFAVRSGHRDRPRFAYRVRLRPIAWRLAERMNSRVFQDASLRDIVETLLTEHQPPFRWLAAAMGEPCEYVVQYEESDWTFVTRLMAEAGVFFFFEPSETQGDVLVLASSEGHYPDLDGRELVLPYRARFDGPGDAPAISDSALHQQLLPERVVARAYDYRQPLRTIEQTAQFDESSSHREQFVHHLEYEDRVDESLAAMANTRLGQERRDIRVMTTTSNSPLARPGHCLTVVDHPVSAFNGRWVPTAMVHEVADGGVYQSELRLVPADTPYRSAAPPRRTVQVTESATVVGPSAGAIHTDEFGRVKIRFHWDRRTNSPRHASCWVRTLQQSVGPQWGAQFIPRVGTEVAVTFVGGDPDRPMVLGQLRNPIHPPPFGPPAQQTRSGWRTRSTSSADLADGPAAPSGYHELSFEDAQGHEEIYLRSEGALREQVQRDHRTTVGGDRNLSIRGATEESSTVRSSGFTGPGCARPTRNPAFRTSKRTMCTTLKAAFPRPFGVTSSKRSMALIGALSRAPLPCS